MESSIITKMKVPDLRNKLIEIGLESKGLKAVLVARLNQYYETCRKQRLMTRKEDEEESNEAVSTDESSEDIDDEKTNKEDSTEESADDDDDDEDEQNEDDDDEQNEDEENDDDDEDAIVEVVSNADPIQKLIEKVTKLTKRNKNTEYVFINKYDHNELAIKAIEEEKIWNKGNKKDKKSDCSRFQKDNICKHLLLQAIRYKYVEVPLTAQTVEFQAAPKRGRPAWISKALQIDSNKSSQAKNTKQQTQKRSVTAEPVNSNKKLKK